MRESKHFVDTRNRISEADQSGIILIVLCIVICNCNYRSGENMRSYSLIKSEKKREKRKKSSDARFSFSTGNNRILILQTFAKFRARIC